MHALLCQKCDRIGLVIQSALQSALQSETIPEVYGHISGEKAIFA